ncbi:MAG: hypothetical protein AB2L07_10260 [Thermoanaerobaculaceae bacterium]
MNDELRFEGRQLKPYAEPVSAAELRQGETYFTLNYADEELLLPYLEPVVFVGWDLLPGDTGQVYFQDLDSYRRGVRFDVETADETATFQSGDGTSIGHVFEFERALDMLLACAIRRQRAGC